MKIQELSLADYKVSTTVFEGCDLLKIFITGSYDVKLGKQYGVTEIHISKWLKFLVKIFNTDKPFGKMKETLLSVKNLETFEYIQEVEMANDSLFLRGFSNESGGWLIYEFKSPQIFINIPC